jgi:hypothetical protein
MNLRQAAQQALEALNDFFTAYPHMTKGYTEDAITALHEALAEPEQERPHPDYPCRSDGRCQYAIDSGAEGLGHCPPGKCCMAARLEPTAQEIQNAAENLALMKRMFPQPEQEPVAWMCADESLVHRGYSRFSRTCEGEWRIPVYTAPTPRKPLTDEECDAIYDALDDWAREFDSSEFGLPRICGGGAEGGRVVIRRAHGIKEQEP